MGHFPLLPPAWMKRDSRNALVPIPRQPCPRIPRQPCPRPISQALSVIFALPVLLLDAFVLAELIL
eukprot:143130-Amphidinium_carterae.1